jgi:hypothetical protein
MDRDYFVFRLLEEDWKLVKSLICDGRTWHEALEALTPIVKKMKLEKHAPPKRRPLRLGLPRKLREALDEKADKTEQPLTEVFLRAAREYRQQHPIK